MLLEIPNHTKNGKVAIKKSGTEIMHDVEKYQNQFIREHEVIDILRHDVKLADKVLAEKLQSENSASAANMAVELPESLMERLQTFEKIYFDSWL